jgi:hypothetical protein
MGLKALPSSMPLVLLTLPWREKGIGVRRPLGVPGSDATLELRSRDGEIDEQPAVLFFFFPRHDLTNDAGYLSASSAHSLRRL